MCGTQGGAGGGRGDRGGTRGGRGVQERRGGRKRHLSQPPVHLEGLPLPSLPLLLHAGCCSPLPATCPHCHQHSRPLPPSPLASPPAAAACRMLFPPRAVTSLSILPATCPHCREHGPPGVQLVQLRVRLSLLPPGTADCPEVTGCVLCSPQIQQIMVRGGGEGVCAVEPARPPALRTAPRSPAVCCAVHRSNRSW